MAAAQEGDEPSASPAGPTLPADRTFVVQVRTDCHPTADAARGRIEHLTSGNSTNFDTWSRLHAFIEQTIFDADSRDGPLSG